VRNAIIFCNRKTTVRDLATSLKRHGFAAGQIQGDMEQADRIRELDRFKNDEVSILVASDVAARGLDIKGVSHVFNFDVPWHPDDYVHRIGRTGRAGRTGIAITLVTREDVEAIDNIQKLIGTKIAEIGGEAEAPAGAEAEAAEPKAAGRRRTSERPARRPRGMGAERVAQAETPNAAEPPEAGEEPKAAEEAPPQRSREERAQRAPSPRGRDGRDERAERPKRAAEQPGRRGRDEEVEPADEGWNGPVPSFLGKGFGG
jgi:superfamily II DNA/RNA helicase